MKPSPFCSLASLFGCLSVFAFLLVPIVVKAQLNDFSGDWEGKYYLSNGVARSLSFTLNVEGDEVNGSYQIENGNDGTIVGEMDDAGNLLMGFVHNDNDCEGRVYYLAVLKAQDLMYFDVSGWDCSGAGWGHGFASRTLVEADSWMSFGIVREMGSGDYGDFYANVEYPETLDSVQLWCPSGQQVDLLWEGSAEAWKDSFFGTVDVMEERFPDGVYAYELDVSGADTVYVIEVLAGPLPEHFPVVTAPLPWESIDLTSSLDITWEPIPDDVESVFLSTYFARGAVIPQLDATSYSYKGTQVVEDDSGDVLLSFNRSVDGLRSHKHRSARVPINATGSRMPTVDAYLLEAEYQGGGMNLIFSSQFHGGPDVVSASLETPDGEVIDYTYYENPQDLAFGEGDTNWAVMEVETLEAGRSRFSSGNYEVTIHFDDSSSESTTLNYDGSTLSGNAEITAPEDGVTLVDDGSDSLLIEWASIPAGAQARVVLVNPLLGSAIPNEAVIEGVDGSVLSEYVNLSEADTGEETLYLDALEWDRAYQVQVIHLLMAGDFYYCTGAKPVFFKTPKSRFMDWQELHFSPEQLADDAVSASTADPDGDGWSNFEEYIFKSNPWEVEVLSPLKLIYNSLDQLRPLIVEVYTNPDIDEDLVVLEQSPDCIHWFPVLKMPGAFSEPEAGLLQLQTELDENVFYRLSLRD